MTDALRRSGREKKRNPRYAFEPLEAEDLENLDPPSEDSTVSSFEDIENKEGEEEDNVLVASEDELLGQDFEDVDGLEDEPNDNEDDLASLEITTVIRPARLKTKQTSSKKIRKQSTKKGRASFREDAVRSRGLLLHASVISKETTVSELAGYDEVLTHKMRIERSKYGGTITLPFREGIGHGKSGMEYPEIYDQEIRENERQAYLNWYYDNGGWQIMAKVQSTSSLEVGSRNIYIPINLPAQDILLGPYNAQHHFVLPNHDSISVSEAWKTAITNTTDSEEYDEAASDRQSWILNLGLRILALDWAANRSGEYQYLAVSTDQARPDHIARVSALGAEEPFEAAVQIWAFKTRNKDEATIMDLSEKPQLVHVICANWGTIRRLSWCPAGTLIEENSDSIGTLAMITSDGYIRVIDVCVDATSSNPYGKVSFPFHNSLINSSY